MFMYLIKASKYFFKAKLKDSSVIIGRDNQLSANNKDQKLFQDRLEKRY